MIDFALVSPELRFVFRRKPLSMPADNRLSWRLPTLLLAVNAVRGKKATFKQIALLSYALNNSENQASLEAYLDGNGSVSEVPIRFEPGLPYLLQVAVQRKLLVVTKTQRYQLTSMGNNAVSETLVLEAFNSEVDFLERYGKKVTDAEADRILALEIAVEP